MQDFESILKLKNPGDRADRLIYWISYLANHFTIPAYRDISTELDLTRHEALILLSLGSLRDELTARDIAAVSGRPKNSVSRAVATLEQRKLIKRRMHVADKRQQPLTLTSSGRKLFERIYDHLGRRAQKATAVLSSQERRQLNSLLAKLVAGSIDWVDG
ncbi:Transcriptional regulator, MarR family [Candidatus Phaeomarinobacter ectocarpi]|uniref:Transcriptional regulator, MarR family n=1 Tax=Candidatus Phaeomarinibacter ectocarpi TaxID=1458461 RepID=X5MFK8_9HYPH|nr:MarR family transcriptional regulator [Candidatus Phaeomarinobacter ectocarpi]CDO59919.1 Transcriptional regulator, MarR family [Candidatus Phaeomarinobacter ectocarpi]